MKTRLKFGIALAGWLAMGAAAMAQQPGQVKLAWDPTATPGAAVYRLYASTNSLTATNLQTATVKLAAGTNFTATVDGMQSGAWHFYATAVVGNIESPPGAELIIQVPARPGNMRTVAMQWNATVSGTNWLDVGFFRLKFGD